MMSSCQLKLDDGGCACSFGLFSFDDGDVFSVFLLCGVCLSFDDGALFVIRAVAIPFHFSV